jgi:uncharacterized phage protein (TIGR01671 family)
MSTSGIPRHDDQVHLKTQKNTLEIETNLAGGKTHTLVSVLDTTLTPMGGRLLKRYLNSPLRDVAILNQRFDVIELFQASPRLSEIRELLQGIGDIERIATRIALKSARPRDLISLKQSLSLLPGLAKALPFSLEKLRLNLGQALGQFSLLEERQGEILELLTRALVDNPPLLIRDGGVIAKGFDPELDELLSLSENATQFLIDLELQERTRTGISTLKISFNRVHGYYIEITKAQAEMGRVPLDYTRRQTIKNAERYITPELKEYEEKIYLQLDGVLMGDFKHTGIVECSEDYIIQQWTGEYDKNRKEIYEGDIISSYSAEFINENYEAEIVFLDAGFHAKVNEKDYRGVWSGDDIEVMGNIFRLPCNPDHNGECLVCDNWVSDCPFRKEKE